MQYYYDSIDNSYMVPMMLQKTYKKINDPCTYSQNIPLEIKLIREAVSDEKYDQMFYDYLISITPTQENKDIILGIRNDEMKHFGLLRQIYFDLVGEMISTVQNSEFAMPASYSQGLQNAMTRELGAIEKNRKILFALKCKKHINMIMEIISDELKHVNLYTVLNSKYACHND
ncbi:MAG: rubrerythrin [Eubacteriaceae bacterium]